MIDQANAFSYSNEPMMAGHFVGSTEKINRSIP
jgi:hypothetical protein